MDYKEENYEFDGDGVYGFFKSKSEKNNITIGDNDYLCIGELGCLPQENDDSEDTNESESDEDHNTNNIKLLEKRISGNQKYLLKLNPKIHKTYQDLLCAFVVESKTQFVDDFNYAEGEEIQSVFDFCRYGELSLDPTVTVFHYKGSRYWDLVFDS